MKAAFLMLPFVALSLVGCDEARQLGQKPPSPGDGSAASAPADYLRSAGRAQQSANKTVDLTAINKAMENFYVQEGRFPKTLEELQDKNYLRALPKPPAGVTFNYDTNSGVVTLEKDLGKE